jgi:hypothetical protein
MPTLDDNEIEELEPSTSSALDDKASQQAAPDTANSSDATGETDADLLSVARDAIDKSRAPDQSASPAESEDDGQSTGAELPKEQDNENFSDVPFHKHPRFQQLLRQSNAYKQDATRYQNVQNFLDTNGLSAEEAADGMLIMSLMKTDPVEAWKRLKPRVQALLVAAGEVLPEDLRLKVQNGEMSQEAALQVSRANAAVQATQVRTSFQQQQRERQEANTAASALTGAAATWEENRRQKDPNFESKLPSLQKEILFLQHSEGKPTTPQGVVAQLQKAYKAVNDALPQQVRQPAQPQKKPAIRPVTGGTVAGGQKPENLSVLDIVRANRATA